MSHSQGGEELKAFRWLRRDEAKQPRCTSLVSIAGHHFPPDSYNLNSLPQHCSLAMSSTCTATHVRTYFRTGTLPPPETVCEVDQPPFPTNATGTTPKRDLVGAEKDFREAVQGLSRGWRFRLGLNL